MTMRVRLLLASVVVAIVAVGCCPLDVCYLCFVPQQTPLPTVHAPSTLPKLSELKAPLQAAGPQRY